MSKKKFYITTAIDYVNAKPHIGHAYEKTLADALARFHRLKGKDVFFLTGVDENAQKNVEAAQKAGISTKQFIETNTQFFIKLCKQLNLSHNDFIRTSAKQHAKVVKEIIKKIYDKGDIYKNTYEGLYCVGCESYYTEKDLLDGKCPEHKKAPELRKEQAYFFKLSKYKNQLLKLIPEYVTPKSKQNEVITRIQEEIKDICISRKGAKWGIDFPEDKEYKIWVWVDALINYISGLKDKEAKYWPADCHIIGKGINWFHSVIWPAILLSAGYKLPEKLLVHGYLNIKGQKISKSLGNVIDPLKLLEKYPTDSVRYSLLKNSVFDDSDYSEQILVERHNNELANKLGNLVSRTTALAEKYNLTKTSNKLLKKLNQKQIEKYFENYEIDKALNEIFTFIDVCNEYIQHKKPWKTKDKKVLYELVDSIKAIAILLSPFIPQTSEKIAKNLNFKVTYENINKPLKINKIKKTAILFEKIEQPKQEQKLRSKEECDWDSLDLRVGEIKKVEDIEGADKLYKIVLDVGEIGERIICAGLKEYYSKNELKDKKIIYFSNLKPRVMRGIESKGMLLAAVSENHKKVVLLKTNQKAKSGTPIIFEIPNKMKNTIEFEAWMKFDLRVGEVKKIKGENIMISDGNKEYKTKIKINLKKGDKIVIGLCKKGLVIPKINSSIIIPEKDIKVGARVS